ncbi:hypothetical protein SPH9361_04792 [Sphingobium sp. CECT 9361]|jgi:hypothetical protein|nr:hypothetical protein SPH9361_04792 [Sphingobium sp. CECT 9361]
MEQDNRESWLNPVAIGMARLFDALDTPLYGGGPRADGWKQRAHPYARSSGMVRCATIRSATMRRRRTAKRLKDFTTKRLSGISRLAA